MSIRALVTREILNELSYKILTVFSDVTTSLSTDELMTLVNDSIKELKNPTSKEDDDIGILITHLTEKVFDATTATVSEKDAYAIVRKDNDYVEETLNDMSGTIAAQIQSLLSVVRISIPEQVEDLTAKIKEKSAEKVSLFDRYAFDRVDIFDWAGLSDNYIKTQVLEFFAKYGMFPRGKVTLRDQKNIFDRIDNQARTALTINLVNVTDVSAVLRDNLVATDLGVKVENCNHLIEMVCDTRKFNQFFLKAKSSLGEDPQGYADIPEVLTATTDYLKCVSELREKFHLFEGEISSQKEDLSDKLFSMRNTFLMILGLGYYFRELKWEMALVLPRNYGDSNSFVPLVNGDVLPANASDEYKEEIAKYVTYSRINKKPFGAYGISIKEFESNKERISALMDKQKAEDKTASDISNREAIIAAAKDVLFVFIKENAGSYSNNSTDVLIRHNRGISQVAAILGRKDVTIEDALTQYFLELYNNPVLTRFANTFNSVVRKMADQFSDLSELKDRAFCSAIMSFLMTYFEARTLRSKH